MKGTKEIIQAMLASGIQGVLCEITVNSDDDIEAIPINDYVREITDNQVILWGGVMDIKALPYITPIDTKGRKIIDFVDGKEVVEEF